MLRSLLLLAALSSALAARAATPGPADLRDAAAELSRRATDHELAAAAADLSAAAAGSSNTAVETAYRRLTACFALVPPAGPAAATLWRAIRRTHDEGLPRVARVE